MSRYHISVDRGDKRDQTMYCISKSPSKLMLFINRLLKRGDRWKVIYVGGDPNRIKKWRYRNARIIQEQS